MQWRLRIAAAAVIVFVILPTFHEFVSWAVLGHASGRRQAYYSARVRPDMTAMPFTRTAQAHRTFDTRTQTPGRFQATLDDSLSKARRATTTGSRNAWTNRIAQAQPGPAIPSVPDNLARRPAPIRQVEYPWVADPPKGVADATTLPDVELGPRFAFDQKLIPGAPRARSTVPTRTTATPKGITQESLIGEGYTVANINESDPRSDSATAVNSGPSGNVVNGTGTVISDPIQVANVSTGSSGNPVSGVDQAQNTPVATESRTQAVASIQDQGSAQLAPLPTVQTATTDVTGTTSVILPLTPSGSGGLSTMTGVAVGVVTGGTGITTTSDQTQIPALVKSDHVDVVSKADVTPAISVVPPVDSSERRESRIKIDPRRFVFAGGGGGGKAIGFDEDHRSTHAAFAHEDVITKPDATPLTSVLLPLESSRPDGSNDHSGSNIDVLAGLTNHDRNEDSNEGRGHNGGDHQGRRSDDKVPDLGIDHLASLWADRYDLSFMSAGFDSHLQSFDAGFFFDASPFSVMSIPEPGTAVLSMLALGALTLHRRKNASA